MGYLKKQLEFNSSRHRLWLENRDFAAAVPAGSVVLDAGSGEAPYRDLFKHAQYESADFEKVDKRYAPSTYVCDLKSIPTAGDRFDFVVFNQVMEHLPEPQLVLNELFRVLKPGGRMIYTGPLFYEEHEQPYDFFRYTQFGLKHLFGTSGFEIQRLEWLEGFLGTMAYQLNCMSRYMPCRPGDFNRGFQGILIACLMMPLKFVFGLLSILFHKLEIRFKYTHRGYPKNYIAILRKPIENRAS